VVDMIRHIRNMIKRAVVSLNPADTGQYPVAQVKWSSNDKAANVQVITPYGFYSVAPANSLALMFSVMGQEENRAAIIDDPANRFKDLKPGEVAVGNPETKSVVKFLENGDIEVTGKSDININITGDVNVTATGNTTITSPIVTVNGALRVTGEITAFYGLAAEINFTDIETKYNLHKHTEFDVGGLTSVPNNTLP
jgi:phage gp45-like